MGYSTDFFGQISLSRNLTDVERSYINKFSDTRKVKRDVNKLMVCFNGEHGYPGVDKNSDPFLIYGNEGEYFVGDEKSCITDRNLPPGHLPYVGRIFEEHKVRNEKMIKIIENGECQPSMYCQWIIEKYDGNDFLIWDGGEKFYCYVEWLKYLINHFFSKWGVILNGNIEWVGEEKDDRGLIVVKDNVVKEKIAKIVYDEDDDE